MEYALLLGANEGERAATLRGAVEALTLLGTIVRLSPVYESAPWGMASELPFLNQALVVDCPLPAWEMLARCQDIELRLGRKPHRRGLTDAYNDRPIDIDILLAGTLQVNQPNLVIPHPRLALRRFALTPLADICPNWTVPPTQLTVKQLLDACPDKLWVTVYVGVKE